MILKNLVFKEIFYGKSSINKIFYGKNIIWKKQENIAQINVYPNNESYGQTYGSGTYNIGDIIELKAIPYIGYKFLNWSDGNISNIRKITIIKDQTYIAYFCLNEGILNYKENY